VGVITVGEFRGDRMNDLTWRVGDLENQYLDGKERVLE